jgi:uncharacterized OB-fold protein
MTAMTSMTDVPTPVTDDPDTGGFFEAAQRGALAVQFCSKCDTPVHLPRPRCLSCGSDELRWGEVNPNGRVYSWTVVAHQVHPAFSTPYTVVLVELADHPAVRLLGHLDGTPDLAVGRSVRATFHPQGPGPAIPHWEVTETSCAPALGSATTERETPC